MKKIKKYLFFSFIVAIIFFLNKFSYAALPTGLDPEVRDGMNCLINEASKKGYRIRVTSTLRTFKQQDALYAKGRCGHGGKIVTKAKAGYSNHNYGTAFDIVDRDKGYDVSRLNAIGKLAGKCNLEWGGNWRSFKDRPHFQKRHTSLKSLRRKYAKDIAEYRKNNPDPCKVTADFSPPAGGGAGGGAGAGDPEHDANPNIPADYPVVEPYNLGEAETLDAARERLCKTENSGGIVNFDSALCEPDKNTFVAFIELIKRILKFIQGAAVILAVVVAMWVAFLMLTKGSNSAEVSRAKEILVNVLIGLFFIFAAWLIVTMILTGLGSNNLDLLNND